MRWLHPAMEFDGIDTDGRLVNPRWALTQRPPTPHERGLVEGQLALLRSIVEGRAVWMSFDPGCELAAERWRLDQTDRASLDVVLVHRDGQNGRAVVRKGLQCRHPHGCRVPPRVKTVVGPDGTTARVVPMTLFQYAARPGGADTSLDCGCGRGT